MAIRNTQLVLKNSNIPNKPFSGGTFLQGEAFVNTADGILMFSGNTQSTSEWTPAGTGGNANFFEVGSNLYDLRLRNRLTKYENALIKQSYNILHHDEDIHKMNIQNQQDKTYYDRLLNKHNIAISLINNLEYETYYPI